MVAYIKAMSILFFNIILISSTEVSSFRCLWDIITGDDEAVPAGEANNDVETPVKIDTAVECQNKTKNDYDDREIKKAPSDNSNDTVAPLYHNAILDLYHNESKVTDIYHERGEKPPSNTSDDTNTTSIAPQVEENKTSKHMASTPPITDSDDGQIKHTNGSTSLPHFDFYTDFSHELSRFLYNYHHFLEHIVIIIIFIVLWKLYLMFKAFEKELRDRNENPNDAEDSEHSGSEVVENAQEAENSGAIEDRVGENTQSERTEHGLLLPSVWTADKVFHYLKMLDPEEISPEDKAYLTDDFVNEVSSFISSQENVAESLKFVTPETLLQKAKFHHELESLQYVGQKERKVIVHVKCE